MVFRFHERVASPLVSQPAFLASVLPPFPSRFLLEDLQTGQMEQPRPRLRRTKSTVLNYHGGAA